MNKAYVSKRWKKIGCPPQELVDIVEEMPVLERIKLPIVRERLNCGVRIEDLHEERYEEALEHIKSEYVEVEPLCKGSHMLEDEEAVEEFLRLVLFWMKDTQSLLAVDETSENLVGLIVVRTYIKRDMPSTYSRVSIHQGKALHKWQKLRHVMEKQCDIYSQYNVDKFACIKIWYVHSDYKNQGIGQALLRAVIEQTKLFKLEVLMGVFSSGTSQAIAKKFNMVSLLEVPYASYVLNKQVVYADTGDNNDSANLMILHLINKEQEEQDNVTTTTTTSTTISNPEEVV